MSRPAIRSMPPRLHGHGVPALGIALPAEPRHGRDTRERSEDLFASLLTAFGLCLLGGGLVAARLGDRPASFRWVAIGVAGSGVAVLLHLGTPFVAVASGGVAAWGGFTAAIGGPWTAVCGGGLPPVVGVVLLSAERHRRVGGAVEDGVAVGEGDAVDAEAPVPTVLVADT